MNLKDLIRIYRVRSVESYRQITTERFMRGSYYRTFGQEKPGVEEVIIIDILSRSAGIYKIVRTLTINEPDTNERVVTTRTRTWTASYDSSLRILRSHRGYRLWVFQPEDFTMTVGKKVYIKNLIP